MNVIIDLGTDKFSHNGIQYFKNFMPHVVNGQLRIVNVYDTKFELVPFTEHTLFIVDGEALASVSLLQAALLPILYTRSSLGGGAMTPFISDDAGNILTTGVDGLLFVGKQPLVYVASLYTAGSSITKTVMKDDLTGVTITRTGAGVYDVEKAGLNNGKQPLVYMSIPDGYNYSWAYAYDGTNKIQIIIIDNNTAASSDSTMNDIVFKLEKYT